MKEYDRNVVESMTPAQLIDNIRSAKPDAKDIKRAEDLFHKSGNSWTRRDLANRQLQAITDTSKFYRRAHAFLAQGVDCSLANTIFYQCNTIEAKQFINTAKTIGKSNREIEQALDNL